MLINGTEYTISSISEDDVVEVIEWNDNEHVNVFKVQALPDDTLGDVIRRAIQGKGEIQ